MGKLTDRKAANVAHHLQDVLIDRVNVEQVVLHLADDHAKIGQETAQISSWFMRRNSCTMPRSLCNSFTGKAVRFSGLARNSGGIQVRRDRHNARRVRVVMPDSSWHSCVTRKV